MIGDAFSLFIVSFGLIFATVATWKMGNAFTPFGAALTTAAWIFGTFSIVIDTLRLIGNDPLSGFGILVRASSISVGFWYLTWMFFPSLLTRSASR